jgi:hypothetical protein
MAKGTREKCANHNCKNLQVASSGKNDEPGARYRAVCSRCHQYSYKGWILPDDVVDFKKYQCSNLNGHLGFDCATDHSKISDVRGKFHIDHIDGDCTNNSLSNLQELCLHCHQEKGMQSGDYAKTNNTGRTSQGRSSKGKATVNSIEAFHDKFYYEESDNDEEVTDDSIKKSA